MHFKLGHSYNFLDMLLDIARNARKIFSSKFYITSHNGVFACAMFNSTILIGLIKDR